jgi:hypothetical protein
VAEHLTNDPEFNGSNHTAVDSKRWEKRFKEQKCFKFGHQAPLLIKTLSIPNPSLTCLEVLLSVKNNL